MTLNQSPHLQCYSTPKKIYSICLFAIFFLFVCLKDILIFCLFFQYFFFSVFLEVIFNRCPCFYKFIRNGRQRIICLDSVRKTNDIRSPRLDQWPPYNAEDTINVKRHTLKFLSKRTLCDINILYEINVQRLWLCTYSDWEYKIGFI